MRSIKSSRKKQGQFIAAPVVSGNASIGSVLTATNGVFDGPTSTYTYQWFLDANPITGATNSTYTITSVNDLILRCMVTATNNIGSVKSISNIFIIRNSFDFVVKTDNISTGSSTATQFNLPFVSTGTYNCTVYWGDGTSSVITTWNQAQTTKTYATAGTYNILITGACNGFCFNNNRDRLKLLSIKSWGVDFRLGNDSGYFWGCSNLDLSKVKDVLNLTGTTNFSNIFRNCSNITTINRINEWNTSNVTLMEGAFWNCIKFNQNIGNWNTSNVTSMASMFNGSILFNQNIGTKIVTVNEATYTAWNTENVTNMSFMFNMWNNGTGTGTFNNRSSNSINNWNTGKVTSMSNMFRSCIQFNQPIDNWNTFQVTNMSNMFRDCWIFNQDISSWNMSKVTTIQNMFINGFLFNQPVGNWNTIRLQNIGSMFQQANSFDMSLANWNIVRINNAFNFMLNNNGLSVSNYDAILIDWAAKPSLNNLVINFGVSKYTTGGAAANARQYLINTKLWTIIDGGQL